MKERIEDYFDAKLAEAEKRQVEADLVTDSDLADDAAFYLQARVAAQEAAHESLLKEKHQQWSNLSGHRAKRLSLNNWIGIAAIGLLLILSVFYFNNPFQKNLSQQAEDLLANNLNELPVHLGEEETSLQSAIQAYNKQQYAQSTEIADSYLVTHPQDPEALKVLGLAYLQLRAYEKALPYFQQLSAQTALYSNPGKYYEALTYLLRNGSGDEETARKLLNEVVSNNLTGKQEALKLLE